MVISGIEQSNIYMNKLNSIINTLPQGYNVNKNNHWVFFKSENNLLPNQGWKIHLSTNYWEAATLLDAVKDELFAMKLDWKIPSDASNLEKLLYADGNITSFGKFITIYPTCIEEFKRVIEILRIKTIDFHDSPRILTDKRYKDSKVVHYRYGAFTSYEFIDEYTGVKNLGIKGPNGVLEKDERVPNKYKPDWVTDPFESEVTVLSNNIFFEKKIKIINVLHRTVKGGVYLIEYGDNQKKAVLKEARKNIVRDSYGRDAIDRLTNEKLNLEKVSILNICPQVYDFFEFQDSQFLIIEYIEGLTLREYIYNYHGVNSKNISLKSIQTLIEGMATNLKNLHELSIMIRDLTPNNIIVDKDGNPKIIDLEISCDLTRDKIPFTGGTHGYQDVLEKNMHFYDYFALGATIYFTACGKDPYFKSKNIRNHEFERTLVRNLMEVKEKTLVKLGLLGLEIMKGKNIDLINSKLEECFWRIPEKESKEYLIELGFLTKAEEYAKYVFNKMTFSNSNSLISPNELSNVFHEVNFNYGLVGLMHFYNEMYQVTKNTLYLNYNIDIYNWIKNNKPYKEGLSNSLYFGYSSLAWILLDMYKLTNDSQILSDAVEVAKKVLIMKTTNTNISHGKAGLGILAVYFYRETKEQFFKEKALDLGKDILSEMKESSILPTYKSNKLKEHFLGYSHGMSGIGYFFVHLYKETRLEMFKEACIEIINLLAIELIS
ncbi:lanthionine synthetase LanC family protein [Solibacillus sp.]|uniref:class III lanthionine synthetase LanKC N-terminal domain-containing protein n=1 Tax=Solibacillus sp. TaxID=1909654 RepID=UPI003315EA4B